MLRLYKSTVPELRGQTESSFHMSVVMALGAIGDGVQPLVLLFMSRRFGVSDKVHLLFD